MIKSFNNRFNTCYIRLAFWHDLRVNLGSLEVLIRNQEHLTPEDVRVLKIIRKGIKDSYGRSQRAEEHHSRQLRKLRKEYLNECSTINESCKY